VAIYSPFSALFFEGTEGASGSLRGKSGGGAELQTVLLARSLAAAGMRVALITFPVEGGPPPMTGSGPDLVERAAYAGDRRRTGKLAESIHIWRAMAAADASVYVFRGSGPQLLVGAAFGRLHRRKLVFSAANDLDFDLNRPDRGRFQLRSFRAALDRADLVVVQRQEQVDLARAAGVDRLELIPSFAETAEAAPGAPEGPLWIGRLVGYKNPLAFLRLAETLPDVPFRMVWLPTVETTEALTEEVEAGAARLDNLELLGRLPRQELLELISRSTAVVSTSAAEGMPNVFLEAWSRGVPVISLHYDPDGKISELDLGLVAGGSEERLREATASLWRDPERRDRMGASGREYVRRAHSPEAVSRRWVDALRPLLGAKRSRAESRPA
jgi:glycosyltransferase involved in cell wall biosynthesis